MTGKMMVFVTCEGREQAEAIAEAVVGEGLAACVNVVPGVRSCYVWEGKRMWSDEVMLMIKTSRGRYERLEARVKALHSYEVPEIVGVGIERGLEAYLKWIG
jgi:periplasmic divalent cation tolerance protein